jgi:molybdopterin-guanine dinucleotide biosynthesis protein A
MGRAKAAIELAGRPLIAYPIDAITAAGLEPVVVAKVDSELPELDCRVVREPESVPHPAAGIVAALRANEGRPVVALGCDMPFVPASLVAFIAGLDAPVAVPRVQDRLQPLLARYDRSAIPALEDAVRCGEPLHQAVRAMAPRIVEEDELARFGEPEGITFNVNDTDELVAAQRLVAVASSG